MSQQKRQNITTINEHINREHYGDLRNPTKVVEEAIIRRNKEFTELDDAEQLEEMTRSIEDPDHGEPIQFDEEGHEIDPEHGESWEDFANGTPLPEENDNQLGRSHSMDNLDECELEPPVLHACSQPTADSFKYPQKSLTEVIISSTMDKANFNPADYKKWRWPDGDERVKGWMGERPKWVQKTVPNK